MLSEQKQQHNDVDELIQIIRQQIKNASQDNMNHVKQLIEHAYNRNEHSEITLLDNDRWMTRDTSIYRFETDVQTTFFRIGSDKVEEVAPKSVLVTTYEPILKK